MINKLRECVKELHIKRTGEEVAQAFSECFQVVRNVAKAYTDNATVQDLLEDCPNLRFLDYREAEVILEQAKAWRHKDDSQESAQPEREPDETDERPQGMEELCQKRMEERQRREKALLAYAHTVAENRHDETAALLNALEDKPLEAKYKDFWDCWGDEEAEA